MAPHAYRVLSHNKFIGFSDGNIVSWCPTMDLLCISMNHTSIWVFRLNGERIYSINNKSPILALTWNPNGKFFVCLGFDNTIKIYNSNNGMLVNTVKGPTGLRIGLVSWLAACLRENDSTNRFDDLFNVDVLNFLPKLSNELDINEASSHANHTPTTNFTPITEEDLDFVVVVSSNALLSITFNNLFTVDETELPPGLKFVKHSTDNDLFSQFFLAVDASQNLLLQELTLGELAAADKKCLVQVILNCSKIISVVNHVQDQLLFLQNECKPFVQLFDRHLSNLKDAVYADVDLTTHFPTEQELRARLKSALYDILFTNLIPASLKDFWLNQLGERGLRKLTKLGNGMYDLLRKTVFAQLVSSIEKLIIILSNLEGLNKWLLNNGRSHTLGLNIDVIHQAIGLCSDLIKLFYAFIWDINEEQAHFNKFLGWCKIEIIDKLSSEDNDVDAFFSANTLQTYKNSDILSYFNDYLFDSKLFKYFTIDTSSHEVLVQRDVFPEHQFIEQFAKLNAALNGKFLEEVKNHILSIICFKNATNLHFSPGQLAPQLQNLNSEEILITATKDQVLSMVKFTKSSGSQQKRGLHFDAQIVNYEVANGTHIIVLTQVKNDFKIESFDLEAIFSVTQENVVYGDISAAKSMVMGPESEGLVKTPKYLAINGKQNRAIGCLLDANKQNYVVFKI